MSEAVKCDEIREGREEYELEPLDVDLEINSEFDNTDE
jgi:hypothetical protein